MAVTRFDAGRLDKFERTGAGGLKIPATIARTGVQIYRTPEGKTIREYRAPEEVFSEDSLASLANAPVTIGHPRVNGVAVAVTPKNYQRLAQGHVSEGAPTKTRVDGDTHEWLKNDLLITSADAQNKAEADELVECSAGYMCDHDETPGTAPDGQAYDRQQINIRYNHVALLSKGQARAGSNARLRFDGDQEPLADEPASADNTQPGKTDMKKVKVDGIDYEFGSESHVAALEKQLAERDATIAAHEETVTASEKEAGETAAKLDSVEKERDEAQAKLDKIDDKVAEVLAFRATAVKLLADDAYDFTGKSDHEVRLDALAKVSPNKDFSSRSETYVEAAYDYALDHADDTEYEHNPDPSPTVDDKGYDEFGAADNAYKASFK